MIKAGLNNNKKQRYKCKGCGCHFTRSDKKGYPQILKQKAVQLYLAGLSNRAVSKVLRISNVTVLNWVREIKKYLHIYRTLEAYTIEIVEQDELIANPYITNKLLNSTFMFRLPQEDSSQLKWVLVMQNLSKKNPATL